MFSNASLLICIVPTGQVIDHGRYVMPNIVPLVKISMEKSILQVSFNPYDDPTSPPIPSRHLASH